MNTEKVTIKWNESAAGGGTSGDESTGGGSNGGKFPEEQKTALQNTLATLLVTKPDGSPVGNNGKHKLTVTIKNGEMTIDNKGPKDNNATEENIRNAIMGIAGVEFKDGKLYINGKLMNDSIYVEVQKKDKN